MKKMQPKKYAFGGNDQPKRNDYPNDQAYLNALTTWQQSQTVKRTESDVIPAVQQFTPNGSFNSQWNLPTNPLQKPLAPQDISIGNGQTINAEQVRLQQDPTQQVQMQPQKTITESWKVTPRLNSDFEKINAGLATTLGIANFVNEGKNRREENNQYIKTLQGKYEINDPLINNQNAYAKFGIDNTNRPIEVEKGEILENQDGTIDKVSDQAPLHDNNGVLVTGVDRVLENTSHLRNDPKSKALLVQPERFEELFGFKSKKPLSHAKALDLATEYFNKQTKKTENKLNDNMEILSTNKQDKYAQNSLDMNLKQLQSHPKAEDIFNTLFEHQELLKDSLGFDNPNYERKYGGYIPKFLDGGKNQPPKHGQERNNGQEQWDNVTKSWIPSTTFESKYLVSTADGNNFHPNSYYDDGGRNYSNLKIYTGDKNDKTNRSLLENQDLQNIARFTNFKGGDEKALQQHLYNYKDENGNQPYKGKIDELHTKYGKLLNNQDMIDGRFGHRWDWIKDVSPYPRGQTVPQDKKSLYGTPPLSTGDLKPLPTTDTFDETTPNDSFNLKQSSSPSTFNEPLRYEDIASPVYNYLDTERTPAKYNPIELNKVRLKLQNPDPTLAQGNRDYNEVLSTLPNTGTGMANATNAFAQKYGIDAGILGQYENINTGIRNQQELYNASVGDKQSTIDAQTRATFEEQQLKGISAQRRQKAESLDDLFSRISQNRKLNREGNLLMKLFPQFNQEGDYNGNQRYATSGVGGNQGGSAFSSQRYYDASGKPIDLLVGANGKVLNKNVNQNPRKPI